MANMVDLQATYTKYMKYGDASSSGMTSKNFAKLCKECKILGWKKLTQTDIDMEFARKIKKGSKMSFEDFKEVLMALAAKKSEVPDALFGMVAGQSPASAHSKVSDTVARLTDASKYTGSHKERFDSSGKGKGLDGRADRAENSGYVGNYKGQNTYDKKEH